MRAIEKAAEAAKRATLDGYSAGEFSRAGYADGFKQMHTRIARAAVLAFLDAVIEDVRGDQERTIALALLSALRAQAGDPE